MALDGFVSACHTFSPFARSQAVGLGLPWDAARAAFQEARDVLAWCWAQLLATGARPQVPGCQTFLHQAESSGQGVEVLMNHHLNE